eukprot:1762969-Amphidinium_carterae.2
MEGGTPEEVDEGEDVPLVQDPAPEASFQQSYTETLMTPLGLWQARLVHVHLRSLDFSSEETSDLLSLALELTQ